MGEQILVNTERSDLGQVRIADEVVGIIAGLAASEVEGVHSMSGGITGGIYDMFGRKNFSKGVKVEVGQVEVAVDIAIFLEYGYRVPDVATRVQENVKKAIESMTGLTVVEINVHVQGIHFPQTQVPEEKETRVK
ncbi:MAG: Asp23/Gls24 family envelope stress response protein [Bacillota bacterium]|jgi:uncharacterized alkaline shock family protein YloU|nr:Asp23/Gls24 family envelope stress response protein [Bacillota bacterium]NLU55134.1 Asp23/Gls24 family envelope stress response protein [Bacillota bacterium]HOA90804.1 Asp23/Gls24 family envelope stress response protein [Bacillota bacterium]HOJ45734.1 Asp23/Gls24 family envelope stress response protein [Bacillota bacterium]HOP53267.1 Asp23/Gls24 family envelope stress response protein [Bacillota bacterium]